MITLEQAKALKYGDELHSETNFNADGTCQRWRVNGQPKVWKTMPERVEVPVKNGLRNYDKLTQSDLWAVHLEAECTRAK